MVIVLQSLVSLFHKTLTAQHHSDNTKFICCVLLNSPGSYTVCEVCCCVVWSLIALHYILCIWITHQQISIGRPVIDTLRSPCIVLYEFFMSTEHQSICWCYCHENTSPYMYPPEDPQWAVVDTLRSPCRVHVLCKLFVDVIAMTTLPRTDQ